jgi:tetratricopeptide (TPR) repeat protein
MIDELVLIESFFNNELDEQQRRAFEERCASDKAFAEVVASYVKMKYGFKQLHRNERKAAFEKIRQEQTMAPVATSRARIYWIAASIAVFLSVLAWLYLSKPDLTESADNYVKDNFMILSTTMSSDKDVFKQAIELFNKGELSKASVMFDSLADYNNPEALKYAGISYMRLQNYPLALEYFETLRNQNLQSNPGAFYQAITLLKRNSKGDLAAAKKLLETVRNQKLEGWQEIEKWNF